MDTPTRASIVTLREISKLSFDKIALQLNLSKSTAHHVFHRTIANAEKDGLKHISKAALKDRPRSGRSEAMSDYDKRRLLRYATKNKANRLKPWFQCALELGMKHSRHTIDKVFREAGYGKYYPRYKPHLSQQAKKTRLQMALSYKKNEEEDPYFWQGCIFTDEMSIEVGLRRGYRLVTRLPDEEWHDHCVVRRYKNYSTIMFWGCIAYNWKGPYHIWEKESAAEKKENDAEVAELAKAAEPEARRIWEAEQAKKTGPRRGRRATFKFKGFTRRGKAGGIDWFRLVLYYINLPWLADRI